MEKIRIMLAILAVLVIANISAGATGMTWVYIDEPNFTGYMSKYETTNAQYCQFLNDALASGDIIVDGHVESGRASDFTGVWVEADPFPYRGGPGMGAYYLPRGGLKPKRR
jgi:hypothetical protein